MLQQLEANVDPALNLVDFFTPNQACDTTTHVGQAT
jgi:hypothetical protein